MFYPLCSPESRLVTSPNPSNPSTQRLPAQSQVPQVSNSHEDPNHEKDLVHQTFSRSHAEPSQTEPTGQVWLLGRGRLRRLTWEVNSRCRSRSQEGFLSKIKDPPPSQGGQKKHLIGGVDNCNFIEDIDMEVFQKTLSALQPSVLAWGRTPVCLVCLVGGTHTHRLEMSAPWSLASGYSR